MLYRLDWAILWNDYLTRDVWLIIALEDTDVVPFAGELQSCCQAAEACSNDENVDASAWICADWCELHCFIFGDGAEDSALCFARMRVDPDKAIRI
jgi:hypothetical protein